MAPVSAVPARRAAVMGSPIAHSLSPTLHRAAYRALGLTGWRYDAVECEVEGFASRLARFGPDVVGLSCTMPLKDAAMAAASQLGPAADAVGAANTLIRIPGGWHADNTDVDGVMGALSEVGVSSPRSVLVLGAGATARAVLVALALKGADAVVVAARDLDRAVRVARRIEQISGLPVEVRGVPERIDPAAFDLVVSTLPGDAAAPFANRFDVADGGPAVLLDVTYAPWPTSLAAAATAAGWAVVGGRSMLLHQAARQVEMMTGRPAPLDAMRAALPT